MKLKSFQRNHHKKEIRWEEKGIRSQDWRPPALAVTSWTLRVLLSLLSPLQNGQANPQLLFPALDSENCAQLLNMTRVLDSFRGGRELCGHWASRARGRDGEGRAVTRLGMGWGSLPRGIHLAVYRDPRPEAQSRSPHSSSQQCWGIPVVGNMSEKFCPSWQDSLADAGVEGQAPASREAGRQCVQWIKSPGVLVQHTWI